MDTIPKFTQQTLRAIVELHAAEPFPPPLGDAINQHVRMQAEKKEASRELEQARVHLRASTVEASEARAQARLDASVDVKAKAAAVTKAEKAADALEQSYADARRASEIAADHVEQQFNQARAELLATATASFDAALHDFLLAVEVLRAQATTAVRRYQVKRLLGGAHKVAKRGAHVDLPVRVNSGHTVEALIDSLAAYRFEPPTKADADEPGAVPPLYYPPLTVGEKEGMVGDDRLGLGYLRTDQATA